MKKTMGIKTIKKTQRTRPEDELLTKKIIKEGQSYLKTLTINIYSYNRCLIKIK